jgi:hypothetical protein
LVGEMRRRTIWSNEYTGICCRILSGACFRRNLFVGSTHRANGNHIRLMPIAGPLNIVPIDVEKSGEGNREILEIGLFSPMLAPSISPIQ